ncbi:unnamed protein product [Periconia digitata]|uniref:Glycosyltransferase family 2 protein n=1 Tax=Periconia digitata TaxID=1303443 RepID=A0A9W4XWW9_9PLEO|nr:unnamed protein product [Periconia digitata]
MWTMLSAHYSKVPWALYTVWILFLWYESRTHEAAQARATKAEQLSLLIHFLPPLVKVFFSSWAKNSGDSALVWLIAIMVFRYYKTVISVYFWNRYKLATVSSCKTSNVKGHFYTSLDCTAIIPTVGPTGNSRFYDMLVSIAVNGPARIIISTNNSESQNQVLNCLPEFKQKFREEYPAGFDYQQPDKSQKGVFKLPPIDVINADVSDKRRQFLKAAKLATTELIAMADDSAVWNRKLLEATLPAFYDKQVAFVGTRKWVILNKFENRIAVPPRENGIWELCRVLAKNAIAEYWHGLWNTIGALYLVRHNFEIRSSDAADGGVFCISGRTSLIRSAIVQDEEFGKEFLNEHVVGPRHWPSRPTWDTLRDWFSRRSWRIWFTWLKGLSWLTGLSWHALRTWRPWKFTPISADDDNFILRWVLKKGMKVKVQYSEDATITTALGFNPRKFWDQCKRWSRTTARQNPKALFLDRVIWWRWPLTVWLTYFPWMWNFALIWDPLMLFMLTRTNMYQTSAHSRLMMTALVALIWSSKLVKTIPWFWENPKLFFLYFFPIPAVPMFSYAHSVLKFMTFFTYWDATWSGRTLEAPASDLKQE